MVSATDHSNFYANGMLFIGGSAFVLTALSSPFLIVPLLHKLPWMTTPKHIIRQGFTQISKLKYDAESSSSSKRIETIHIVDLGSGDGRVCIEAAKLGYHATGYEVRLIKILMVS